MKKLLSATLLLLSLSAWADDPSNKAKLVESENKNEQISNLKWISSDLTVEFEEKEGVKVPVVTLAGELEHGEDWTLIWDKTELPLKTETGASPKFSLRVPLQGPLTQITVLGISPLGSTQEAHIIIKYDDWEKAIAPPPPPPEDSESPLVEEKKITVLPSLGITSISYQETGILPYSEILITPKVSGVYPLPWKNFEVGANAYFTALPIATNQKGISALFLGMNARVGYVFPQIESPWRVSLMAGLYYTTMFVTSNSFGFNNMSGPQLFPVVRRVLGGGNTVSVYAKFSPIFTGSSISFASAETAFGGSWSRLLGNGHRAMLNIDYSNMKLTFSDIGLNINTSSFSVSFGYGL